MVNSREIKPPHVSLGFYYSIPDFMAYKKVYSSLVNLGAKPMERCLIVRGQNVNSLKFDRISSFWEESEIVYSIADKFWNDSTVRVLQAYLHNAVSNIERMNEWLTYAPLSKEAMKSSQHPIELVIDGSVFFVPKEYMSEAEIAIAGKLSSRIKKRFIETIEMTLPLYAAITMEASLLAPTDLKNDYCDLVFRDCYISKNAVLAEDYEIISNTISSQYIKYVANGMFISISDYLNFDIAEWKPPVDGYELSNELLCKAIRKNS